MVSFARPNPWQSKYKVLVQRAKCRAGTRETTPWVLPGQSSLSGTGHEAMTWATIGMASDQQVPPAFESGATV